MKSFEEIAAVIVEQLGEEVLLKAEGGVIQPYLELNPQYLPDVCRFLFQDPELYFDFLSCITGIDNGPEAGSMEVIYHLSSIPYGHRLVLKVTIPREGKNSELPSVPTVSGIWRTADWHEREVYDLLGIQFDGHSDMRRILLPADWEGYPLRKDYQEQEYYHGIKVKYEDRNDPGADSN